MELVRQYIPFADKLINKIAESGPVQGLMKPLEQPVKAVGGMIDQVTGKAVDMVEDSEQMAVSTLGNGTKILTGLAGATIGAKAASSSGGKKEEGGDFLGTIKGGIHTRLLAFGQKLLQSGKALLMKGVDKLRGMLTPKVKFRLGNEEHELWVEKGKNRNIVMMASDEGKDILKNTKVVKEMKEKPELYGIFTKIQKEENPPTLETEKFAKGLEDGSKRAGEAYFRKLRAKVYDKLLYDSVQNRGYKSIMLGKYNAEGKSYITAAGKYKSSYFDMGYEFNKVQKNYNLSNQEVFEYFNKPFLKEAADRGDILRFSHAPRVYGGFLGQEWSCLQSRGFTKLIQEGDVWIAK